MLTPTRLRGARHRAVATEADRQRRMREEVVAHALCLEMMAEQIVEPDGGVMVAMNHGRRYKIEVKAFEIGAEDDAEE